MRRIHYPFIPIPISPHKVSGLYLLKINCFNVIHWSDIYPYIFVLYCRYSSFCSICRKAKDNI